MSATTITRDAHGTPVWRAWCEPCKTNYWQHDEAEAQAWAERHEAMHGRTS